jgi:transposase
MFIRETKTKNTKTGKVYRKYTLVQSVRTDEGPRQRTVMQLGQISIPRKSWPALAAEIERRIAGQGEFSLRGLDRSDAVLRAADRAMEDFGPRAELKAENVCRENQARFARVDLNTATSSISRSVGPELLVHEAWRLFELPRLLKELGFDAFDRSLAEAVVAARMINPGSDLSNWYWIRNLSAIGELTEENLSNIGRNRVYAIADRLCAVRGAIEAQIRNRVERLFPCERQLFLFDLTNFYLEGQALGNSLAHHGKCKQKRSDCRLVSLALAVDARGFPLFSRIYPGNIGEPATLRDVLGDAGLLDRQPSLPTIGLPTVIMDRGIATDENVNLLIGNNISYIVIERGARNKEYLQAFRNAERDPTFTRIDRGGSDDILVKKVDGDREGTVRVLCASGGKKKKEQAMVRRWEERACEDLLKLQASVRSGTIRQSDKIIRKLGRLDERYSGFSKRFAVTLVPEEANENRIADLFFERKPFFELPSEEENPLLGTYVIETPLQDLDATQIWQLYMTLTRVEDAFRSFKTDLGTRPIYHQLAERTTAHLFISVLAYGLLASIEYRLENAGDQRRWQTIREILQSHRRDTIMLTDEHGTIHHIRQTGAPEPVHLDIYRKLGVSYAMPRFSKAVAKRL